jgi:ribonucleoside-diphosphate reductase subunit M2
MAAAIETMGLCTPTKPSRKAAVPLVDDEQELYSPQSYEGEEEPVEEFRRRFVGDVDLPESECH